MRGGRRGTAACGEILHIDEAVRIDVPDPAGARSAGDARHGAAILRDLHPVTLDTGIIDLAALVVDDDVAAVDANQAVEAALDDVAALVDKRDRQLATHYLGLFDAAIRV